MRQSRRRTLTGVCAIVLMVTAAGALAMHDATAANVNVSSNITTSQTWTKNNDYRLTQPIYVTGGATLTIQAGTVIRGEPSDLDPNGNPLNNPGTLIIARGSKLFANGTMMEPIVFTDLLDDHVRGNAGTDPYDTFDNASGLVGRWGGLILLGRAYVANNSAAAADPNREVQIEGLTAAGGLGLYGNGGNDNDDSGSISYLIIRYGGFNLSVNNEINGLTLGAVGRETDINFVEVFQNKDDGIEFFGGTVNVKNLIVANGGDDGVDYDEGFRGKGQFILVLQGTPGTDRSDKGGEHDGGNSPDQSLPRATPAFYNVTYIGLGSDKTTYTGRSTNTALHLRDNAGGRFYNSAILDFGGAETLIEGATLPGAGNAANTSGQRSQFAYTIDGTFNLGPASAFELEYEDNDLWCIGRQEDLGVPLTLPTGDSTTYGGDAGKNHWDNGFYTTAALDNTYLGCSPGTLPIRALVRTDSGDTATADPVTTLDPRPAPGSPLLTTDRTPPADGFFMPAPYKGAFGPTENWAFGWTSLYQLGILPAAIPQVEVAADITTSQTWTAGNEYILKNPIYVTGGATLTIEAGTVVRGEPRDLDPNGNPLNNPGTLIITRGSKIFANGTPKKPIVFTDLQDDNVRGNPNPSSQYTAYDEAQQLTGRWGGLVLLGRGYVANNTGTAADPNREVQIEGLTFEAGKGLYGNGGNDNDDSGSLRNIIIRYGGFNLSANNEINGLTLGAVGRETDINFVEVFQNKDDGIEFFGGTVNIKNVIVANSGDDGVDYDEGFRGKGQFILVLQGLPGIDRSDKGGEHDGGNSPDQSLPRATPAFYNVTYIGLGADKTTYTGRASNTALHLRDNAGGRFYNSAILDFGGAEALIEGGTLPGDANAPNTSGQRAQFPYTLSSFNLGPVSTFELEFEDNDLWCIGRQEDLGVPLTLPTGDSVTYGGDSGKNHFDNGFYSNPGLDNSYLGCDPNSLPIRALVRTDLFADAAVADPVTTLDPRPKVGSPLLTTDRTPPVDGFFTPAPYKGAFSSDEFWASGWTSLAQLGIVPGCNGSVGLGPNAVPNLSVGALLNPVVAGGPIAREHYLSWEWPLGAQMTETFDLLRATSASGFNSAICLEIDGADLEAADTQVPSLGTIWHYLVRAGNGCAEGSLGANSAGAPRTGTSCP